MDCYINSARYDMVLEYCRRLSKLSLIKSSTTLQYGRYADKELEHARYDMVLEYCRRLSRFGLIRSPTTLQYGRYADKELEHARYDMVLEYCRRLSKLSLIKSSTTLQHGRYADKELEQWNISFCTIVTNVNGSLEAVDCYIHSARYDMVLEYCRRLSKLSLIKSPTTMYHSMNVT
eukprot:scaffold14737_cov197-Skeletonema_marinoi.AAC.4